MDDNAQFARLCVHTITNKPWPLRACVDAYAAAGIGGITVWRNTLEGLSLPEAAHILQDAGLEPVSLCRGGFFPAYEASERQAAIDDNRRAIDEAHGIGAPLIVLVCGAVPGMPLEVGRRQIQDGIAAIEPHASQAGVTLAIEPLHPMYADARSAVTTLRQANDMVEALRSPWVGIALDVYHVWWDDSLETEIRRAGRAIRAFHVCDWRTPTRDLLTDRTLMGEGCIPIRAIREQVEAAGFQGYIEVEIFSSDYWGMDQALYLQEIKQAYLEHVL